MIRMPDRSLRVYKGPDSPDPLMGLIQTLSFKCRLLAGQNNSITCMHRENEVGKVKILRSGDFEFVHTTLKVTGKDILLHFSYNDALATIANVRDASKIKAIPIGVWDDDHTVFTKWSTGEVTGSPDRVWFTIWFREHPGVLLSKLLYFFRVSYETGGNIEIGAFPSGTLITQIDFFGVGSLAARTTYMSYVTDTGSPYVFGQGLGSGGDMTLYLRKGDTPVFSIGPFTRTGDGFNDEWDGALIGETQMSSNGIQVIFRYASGVDSQYYVGIFSYLGVTLYYEFIFDTTEGVYYQSFFVDDGKGGSYGVTISRKYSYNIANTPPWLYTHTCYVVHIAADETTSGYSFVLPNDIDGTHYDYINSIGMIKEMFYVQYTIWDAWDSNWPNANPTRRIGIFNLAKNGEFVKSYTKDLDGNGYAGFSLAVCQAKI